MESVFTLWSFVSIPNSQEVYAYGIEELEKFAVQNGVIMAYSSYVDKEAVAYIQENYYHWFVIIPEKEIAEGFHTEDEFNQYIQTLGSKNLIGKRRMKRMSDLSKLVVWSGSQTANEPVWRRFYLPQHNR